MSSDITSVLASHSRAYFTTPARSEGGQGNQPLERKSDPGWDFLASYSQQYTNKVESKSDPQKTWQTMSENARTALEKSDVPNPYSGRSVKVFNGKVAEALARLDSLLARNRVKHEWRSAERHEKKGAKRRRLKSERWRIRFADEVRRKVQLVNAIRRRGS